MFRCMKSAYVFGVNSDVSLILLVALGVKVLKSGEKHENE